MNIAHIISSLDPAGGGPAAVVGRLASAQGTLGHEVHILTTPDPRRIEAVEQSLRDIPGIAAVHRHDLPPLGLKQALFGIPQEWRKMIGRMEVLHLHGVWEPLLLGAARAAMKMKIPYAITPHGMLDPWSLRQKSMKKRLALMLGYRQMLNCAAFLHALNKDEAQLLKPLGLKCSTEVIPNGVFLEEFSNLPSAQQFRHRVPGLDDWPYILFLSRLHFKKGLDYLAGAFKEVAAKRPDIHLVVAGPDGGAEASFRQDIESAGLQARAHLVGPLYGSDKLEALAGAACFCLPSRQEGFSIAITEALACGLPVVISENCHFPEVEEVGAGKVVPLNVQAIAEALLEVIINTESAVQMGEAGQKLVTDRFTWPVIASKAIEAYRNTDLFANK